MKGECKSHVQLVLIGVLFLLQGLEEYPFAFITLHYQMSQETLRIQKGKGIFRWL